MKPELANLLHRLSTQLDGFQTLIIFPSGRAMATHRNGIRDFTSLDAVEKFAYAPAADPINTGLQPGASPSSDLPAVSTASPVPR